MCGSYIVVMVKFRVNLTFEWDEQVKEHVHSSGVKNLYAFFRLEFVKFAF